MYKQQETFEIFIKLSDTIELPFLLRHALFYNEEICNFTHHAVRYPKARGILPST